MSRTYTFKHVDLPNKVDPIYNQLCDVLYVNVPTYITSDAILSDIIEPMHFFLNYFSFNLERVEQIDLFILNRDDSNYVFRSNENGNMTRKRPHQYKILIRNIKGCIEAILHELMHVIDEEIDHFLIHLHHKNFEYNLRYYETRAFTFSKIAHTEMLYNRNPDNFDRMNAGLKLSNFREYILKSKEELIDYYTDDDICTASGMFGCSLDAFNECIKVLNAYINSL